MTRPINSKSRILLICWLPLIIYCLAIYMQSGRPGPEKIPDVRFLDKFLHFGAYGLLGVLFFRAYETLPLKKFKNLLIFISIASATLYGISDEIHPPIEDVIDRGHLNGLKHLTPSKQPIHPMPGESAGRDPVCQHVR